MADSGGDRLDGWKAVAAYLNRNVRTVQRWERTEQLPIHRHSHKKQAFAWAYRSELNEWLRQRSADATSEVVSCTPPEFGHQLHAQQTPPSAEPSRWNLISAVRLAAAVVVSVSLVILVITLGVFGSERSGPETLNELAYLDFAEGRALYAARQYDAALPVVEKAVARDSKFTSAWVLLAKVYGRLGHRGLLERAVEVGERVEELAPERAETHIALALIARARQDLEVWRAEANRAIELDPHAGEAYAVLADSYSGGVAFACNRDQNPELAEHYYRKAAEVSPELTSAVMNRAKNLRQLGRYSECDEIMTEAMKRSSDSMMAASRGLCRLMDGDLVGAAADIEPLRGDPRVPQQRALTRLSWLQLKRGQTADGLRDLDAAARLLAVPTSKHFLSTPEEQLSVAAIYASIGDTSRAANLVELALQNDPACAKIVASATAFTPSSLRGVPEVRATLAKYGIE